MDIADLAAARAARAQALAGQAPPPREVRLRDADGKLLCCRETLAALQSEVDEPSFVVVIEDISASRREMEKIRASEARYRPLFEHAPEAMLVSVEGRVRLANAASRRLVGDGESLDELRMLDLVHPDDRAMESERIAHFEADRLQQLLPPLPVRYQRQDGKPLRVEASGVRIAFEGRDALLYVLRDVARWQNAEQVLQESRALYRDVVESMNEILFQTDAAYRLNFLNRAWHQITGFDGRLSLGQNLLDFVIAEDRMPVERALQSIREGFHDSVRFEFRLRTQTAGPCWVEATVRPLRDGLDQTVGTSGTLDDITDRKNAEQSQRDLNAELETRVRVRTAQLEASNRELEAFSYSVSHDLRAPLRAIDGFAQIVAEDYAPRLDQTGKEYLQRIRVATQRMAALIDDLIDLARLTRQTMKREPVDLSRLAETIFAELRQEEPERRVEIHVEPNLVAAADRALIRVALDNLLRNAWKFTSRNGVAQIRFHAEQRDRQTIYCVSDNGAGFDMCFASKLFLPFHRLHGINEFAGTGIGLATVQRVIHRHEGKIWAQSYPDKGASFFFTLCH
jgi:PAS domain S-box-containing protein